MIAWTFNGRYELPGIRVISSWKQRTRNKKKRCSIPQNRWTQDAAVKPQAEEKCSQIPAVLSKDAKVWLGMSADTKVCLGISADAFERTARDDLGR